MALNHDPDILPRIEEGQFYEAHQQLRVIASRYVKQGNWDAAIDILASGAQLLLKAGQGGSGGDLCLLLVDTYNKAEVKPDAAAKARILSLMRAFPAGEPTRKRFIGEAIAYVCLSWQFYVLLELTRNRWSSKLGEFPAGDPDLHHVAGSLYAEGKKVH